MNKLKQQLISTAQGYKMNINLNTTIINGISAWRGDKASLDQLNYPEHCRIFIDDMNSIGWDELFQMRVSLRCKSLHNQQIKQKKDVYILLCIIWTSWKSL